VLTNGNYFARLILGPLFEAQGKNIAAVILISGDYRGRTGFPALRWLLPATTFPYLVYKIVQMAAIAVARRLCRTPAFDVKALAARYGIPVRSFRSIREDEAIRAVEEARPDLAVSVSCPQKIGDRVLRAARFGGINIHSSLLPRYAGLAPYFWVLAEGEQVTGTTVHYMTNNFDEGHILGQAEVTIAARTSAFALFRELALAGGPLLQKSVELALAGDRGTPQVKELYSYRSHPDTRSYMRLRRRGHRLLRVRDLVRLVVGFPSAGKDPL
jgi:methionyl-tRNA formyltransferase